ncbi:uncharacterized protein J4E92_006293 [Alternaria infectoria]|uniref:uncharacterized protein n=1 Tax=Alternaria infectoria TaxID=45303 RepID=UPI00222005FD|nr:uncharacterized protein J4E92_006293 [Alternaria infectoria]KAI4927128.1 hypothetical protein J4E92_006293 [Alternaria infectoria]
MTSNDDLAPLEPLHTSIGLGEEKPASGGVKRDSAEPDTTANKDIASPGQVPSKRPRSRSSSQSEDAVSKKPKLNDPAPITTPIPALVPTPIPAPVAIPAPATSANGRQGLLKLPVELLDNVMEHLYHEKKGRQFLYDVTQVCKYLQAPAARPLYQHVAINIDQSPCQDASFMADTYLPCTLDQMKLHQTRTLTLSASNDEEVGYILAEFLMELRDVPLKELRLTDVSLSRKVDTYLQMLFDADSMPLKENLKELYLPWACDSIPQPHRMMDSSVNYTFQPTRRESKDALLVHGGGYKAMSHRNSETGTSVNMFRRVLGAFGFPTAQGFESVSWSMRWPEHDCANIFDMAPAPPPTIRCFNITHLSLGHFDFGHGFPQDTYTCINFSSIRRLELDDCQLLPRFLRHFMATGVSLQKLDVQNWDYAEELWEENPHGLEAFLASFSTLKDLKVVSLNPWQPDLARMISSHSDLESCDLSFGANSLNVGMLKKILAIRPNLKRLGFRHLMFGLPWKHDGFAGKIHGVTGAQITGFDNRFAAYAEVLANFSELETVVAYFEPFESDGGSSKEGPGGDNPPDDPMYQRLSDRILQEIRRVASKNGLGESKVATMVLHDKALPGEDLLGEEDVVDQNYYEREYKYKSGTSSKMSFLA